MPLPFNKARADAQPETIYTFPYVSWRHGRRANKAAGGISYTGGFMIGSKDAPATIQGWKEEEIITKKGEVMALCANPAYITILRWRERWETKENGKQQSTLHAVGFIMGCDDPVCFVVTGTATSYFKTILREHQKVAAFANKDRPKGTEPIPRYLFWLKVEADTHTSAGSGNDTSDATYPKIVLPQQFTAEYIEKVFVGEKLMDTFQDLFVELEPWVTQWPSAKQREPEHRDGSEDDHHDTQSSKGFTTDEQGRTVSPPMDDSDNIPFN